MKPNIKNTKQQTLVIASLAAMLLGGCAAPNPQPVRPVIQPMDGVTGVAMTMKSKGDSRPISYNITANQVTATRKNANGTVSTGTGRNITEAVADLKKH